MSFKSIWLIFITLFSACVFAQNDSTSGLKIGDKAPQFVGVDNHAMPIYLNRLLKQGPVILMFYHGSWSNSTLTQLKALQDSLKMIYDMGGEVVAITTESVENVIRSVKGTNTNFPIISDKNRMITLRYKVGKTMEANKLDAYKAKGFDVKSMTGDGTAFVSMPATYIIGQDGIIKAAFISKEYDITPTITYIIAKLMEQGLRPKPRNMEDDG